MSQQTWVLTRKVRPDDGMTVIGHFPGADEPVWLCYKEGTTWRDIGGGCIKAPKHWREMPLPPGQVAITGPQRFDHKAENRRLSFGAVSRTVNGENAQFDTLQCLALDLAVRREALLEERGT